MPDQTDPTNNFMEYTSPDRTFHVPALGDRSVGLKNACWTFCTSLDIRDKLAVGESAELWFHSSAGNTVDTVTRTK